MTLGIEHAGKSDPGRVRERNEDSWVADPAMGLYAVSDGMGGRFEGALASKIVVEALPRVLGVRAKGLSGSDAADAVASSVAELSESVRARTAGQPGLDGMGATLVAALVRGNEAVIAHMGDSRAYLLRSGRLEQLTSDHSLAQLLVDGGELQPEGARTHPSRDHLTRYVGMDGTPLPEAKCLELHQGDQLLLCTDGLTGMLDDGKLAELLDGAPSPEDACSSLIDAANLAGGKDNITALVVRIS